jgi:hypothetical protein
MIQAIKQLRAAPDTLLYAKLFFAENLKFQYPISSLLLVDFAQRITGAGWLSVVSMLNWISWLAVWATAYASWRLFIGRDGRLVSGATPVDRLLLAGGIVAMTVLFYPFSVSYALGQIQTEITLLVALSLLAWRADRKWLAGVCLGLCCTIKPQWGLVFLWALLRREWGMTAAGAVTGGAVGLIAGMLYGFHQYLDYLPVISYLAEHGESYFPNQSMNGLVNRLLGTGNNLTWVDDAFPAYHPAVHIATTVSSVVLLGGALLYRRRAKADALDLALMILSLTMASPIAWVHHYGALLPIFAFAAPIAVERKPFGRATVPVLLIAFIVASERLDLANRLWDTALNPLQSYLYFTAAAVLVLLYRLAGADAATDEPRAAVAAEPGRFASISTALLSAPMSWWKAFLRPFGRGGAQMPAAFHARRQGSAQGRARQRLPGELRALPYDEEVAVPVESQGPWRALDPGHCRRGSG